MISDPIEPQNKTLFVGVALVSFASLLLELSLTRLFSVVLFYHFAFLAISIALLGLGAGGVFAYVRKPLLARFPIESIAAAVCVFNAIAIVIGLAIVLHTNVSLGFSAQNLLLLTKIYLTLAVPFFGVGLLFSVLFAREHERISQLYSADLVGGALACLATVPALNYL